MVIIAHLKYILDQIVFLCYFLFTYVIDILEINTMIIGLVWFFFSFYIYVHFLL